MSTFQANAPVTAHDSDTPPNLVQFMLKHWQVSKTTVEPLKYAACHQARRTRLSQQFPGELLVIPTGHRKLRAGDQFYPFRPGSDFFYLTGCHESDCVLVLEPRGDSHEAVLFIEDNAGKSDARFFTDRLKGELWEGPRLGVPETAVLTGIRARDLGELSEYLRQQAAAAPKGWRILRAYSPLCEAALPIRSEPKGQDQQLAQALAEARLLKDEAELAELDAVVKATKLGFEDVIRALRTARSERELETTFYARARLEGNDVGYGTIAAAGEHACTLHWKRNNGLLRPADLLLLDAGIEGHHLYTADITRTLPIGGRFSREQRDIYELVFTAQRAALAEVKPGVDFMRPNVVAMQIMAHGLERLGILPMPATEALKPENQFYKRYTLHNISHMLGLDVHDCAKARAEAYKYGKLRPGMVLTIEPGLYFQPDDLTVPAKYRGIGVRIEDDVVVTTAGHLNLSAAIPSEASEVEAWMQSVWARSVSDGMEQTEGRGV